LRVRIKSFKVKHYYFALWIEYGAHILTRKTKPSLLAVEKCWEISFSGISNKEEKGCFIGLI
jgi:hypothetical protein